MQAIGPFEFKTVLTFYSFTHKVKLFYMVEDQIDLLMSTSSYVSAAICHILSLIYLAL